MYVRVLYPCLVRLPNRYNTSVTILPHGRCVLIAILHDGLTSLVAGGGEDKSASAATPLLCIYTVSWTMALLVLGYLDCDV
jgi:hypothetical protein